jgi:hypothetical protein
MTVTITDLDWRLRAACRDHPLGADAWFADEPHLRAQAEAVCLRCPVIFDCLASAMAAEAGRDPSGRSGIAGGLGPRGRWQLEQCELGRCVHLEHQGGGL